MIKTDYERALPHIQPVGAKFFVTFRLFDSLPAHVIDQLVFEREKNIRQLEFVKSARTRQLIINEHKRYFKKFDDHLDNTSYGNHWLKEKEVAQVVMDKIHAYDHDLYELIACCIMHNHVHLLIDTSTQLHQLDEQEDIREDNYRPLYRILKLIKGGSAYEANKVLGRNGSFWAKESYDHYVRDDKELLNIIDYTLQNPVKVGLAYDWKSWKFNYLNENYV